MLKKDTILFENISCIFDNSRVTAKTIYTSIKCLFLTAVNVIQNGDDPNKRHTILMLIVCLANISMQVSYH